MKACLVNECGPVDTALQYTDAPVPAKAAGQVRLL